MRSELLSIQLGGNSRLAGTERTTSYASEIISHDLELAQLQVDAEAEENETQTLMAKVDR